MLFSSAKPDQSTQASGPVVFDVSAQDFEVRVMQASMDKPVIVDFWAPWCGPCKQLGPALEKAVQAAGGKVLMAKVNLDENPELAGALHVQSVPTVFAFFGGRPIDAFQGALPESQIKAFINKIIEIARQARPDALDISEALKTAAGALAAGDLIMAQELYVQILQQDEKNAPAYIGLVRLFIAAGQIEQAQGMVDNAPDDIAAHGDFAQARTALELASIAPVSGTQDLEAKVKAAPEDYQARFDLALALFAAGKKSEAMDQLLEIISRKPGWNEDAARKQLLKFFEALGFADPLVVESRRRLSSLLFS